MKNKPTVISTFAGCGGSSLGYKMAGYHELLAVDFETHAHEIFKLNFPEVLAWQADIKDVTAQMVFDACKIKRGDLDVFDGSPPCQGFSTTGKRKINDARNDLFMEYVRMINDLQPKVFVMENVSGMIKGKMKGRFLEIMDSLESTGYTVKCRLMNSANYGVAQSRPRVIFIGVRPDLGIEPSFPPVQKGIKTFYEAVKGVENKTFGKTGPVMIDRWMKMTAGTNFSKITEGANFSTMRLNGRKPAPTIVKSVRPNMAGQMHPDEPRLLTIEEIKRICSFPDEFRLEGKFVDQWARLGNAVMPKFMEAIARHIRTEILEKTKD